MPITLPAVSRRRFVLSALGAGVGLATGTRWGRAAVNVPVVPDGDRVVLLSDLHISSNPERISWGVNTTERLRMAVGQVLASGTGAARRPSMVIVNGDCSLGAGHTGDYVNLLRLLKPLRTAGWPVHLGLGNHDHRDRFRAAMSAADLGRDVPASAQGTKHAMVLETPRADWVLLDSLDRTKSTSGRIGNAQLHWLAGVLDDPRRQGKPVIVVMHHHPVFADDLAARRAATLWPVRNDGVADTEDLMAVVAPRRNVKALVFGHTHVWSHRVRDGLHLVNLPTTAYVFDSKQPAGWVDCLTRDDGAALTLRALDGRHPKNGQVLNLRWRA